MKKTLQFKVVQNDSLNIFMGGTKKNSIGMTLPFFLEDGSLNNKMVAVVCANEKK